MLPDVRKEVHQNVNWWLLWWSKSHGSEGKIKTPGRSRSLQNSQATNSRYSACPNLQEKGIEPQSKTLGSNPKSKEYWALSVRRRQKILIKYTKHFQLYRRLMDFPLPFQAWEAKWMEIYYLLRQRTTSRAQAQAGWHRLTLQQCTNTCSREYQAQSS